MEDEPREDRFVPASVVLERLHRAAPKDELTVQWVLDSLDQQSFGIVLLLLAILAVVPGVCSIAGVLIAISGFEMAVGRKEPYFSHWIATRTFPARPVGPVVVRAIAVLRVVERAIHPRWPGLTNKLTRVVGMTVLLASVRLILVPLPFSNILPAMAIGLVSLAYLEEDGLLLSVALALAVGNAALDVALARESITGLGSLRGLMP